MQYPKSAMSTKSVLLILSLFCVPALAGEALPDLRSKNAATGLSIYNEDETEASFEVPMEPQTKSIGLGKAPEINQMEAAIEKLKAKANGKEPAREAVMVAPLTNNPRRNFGIISFPRKNVDGEESSVTGVGIQLKPTE